MWKRGWEGRTSASNFSNLANSTCFKGSVWALTRLSGGNNTGLPIRLLEDSELGSMFEGRCLMERVILGMVFWEQGILRRDYWEDTIVQEVRLSVSVTLRLR